MDKEQPRQPGNDFQSQRTSDPTSLTTQMILREIAALKELVFTRLQAMDTAIVVAHDDLVRVPTEVQKAVGNLESLHDEKFKGVEKEFDNRDSLYAEKFRSIQTQFEERDTREEQKSKDNKVAIDAALQAQKEAVGKSETATVKQIDQLGILIAEKSKASDDKISDVKDRLTRLEGRGEGAKASTDYTWVVIGAAIALIGIASRFL